MRLSIVLMLLCLIFLVTSKRNTKSNSNNRGVSKAREKVHNRINSNSNSNRSNSNKNKNKNNHRNQSNHGNNRNTDSSRNRSKGKKKEQPGSNVGHSVISTHKTSDKGNQMAYALDEARRQRHRMDEMKRRQKSTPRPIHHHSNTHIHSYPNSLPYNNHPNQNTVIVVQQKPKSDIKKKIAMKVGKKVAKFLGKKLFGSNKQKKVPTERIYPVRPVSVGIPEMIRPNQALIFNYTNKFREDVFSQNSTYLAYNLTSNVYTIKQTAPNFSYGQHLYYFGPTYKFYNQEVKDTKMCQFKFDRSDEVSIGSTDKMDVEIAEIYGSNKTVSAGGNIEFGKVQFQNGTRVYEFSFGCDKFEDCCELQCCNYAGRVH